MQQRLGASVVVLDHGMRRVGAAMVFEVQFAAPSYQLLAGIGSVSDFVEEVFKRGTNVHFTNVAPGVGSSTNTTKANRGQWVVS